MSLTFYAPFETTKSLTPTVGPALTLARALNTATVVNSSGFIEGVNANLPRFDHDPVTLESLGLLREPTRTNLCLQSNDLSATWTNVRSTDSQSAGTSPDGTNNANSIDEDGTAANTHFVDQAVAMANTTQYTYSVYLKASNRDWVMLQAYGIGAVSTTTYYDLTNGVTGSYTNIDAIGIEDAGNGWYRCWQTFTTGTVTTSHVIIVAAEGNADFTFDGLSQESILMYGAQLEVGGFRTSYIPTTTGALARNADVISTTDLSWFNEAAGTFYMDYYYPEAVDGTPVVVEISDGTTAERHLVYHSASGETTYLLTDGGAGQATLTATGITLGARTRSVIAYELNDVEHYFDGARVGTGDQVATMPTVDRMYIGSDRLVANGITTHIREIRYDDTRLANSVLANWSNGEFLFTDAAFDADAFDTDAFSSLSFYMGEGGIVSVASDGGGLWPPRGNDPRWIAFMTANGITPSRGGIGNDVREALGNALGYAPTVTNKMTLDDVWKRFKIAQGKANYSSEDSFP